MLINLKTNYYLCHILLFFKVYLELLCICFNETAELLILLTPLF